jgi:uncharacterized protein (TIGR03435 family)
MKRLNFVYTTLAVLFFSASLFAQTPAKLAFEVASIKPSPPLSSLISEIQSGKLDIGMRMDGSRVDFKFMPLLSLIAEAYKVKQYQVSGPDWIKTQLFEIHAKLPEGSTKEQIPQMLQTFLAERFNLTFHRETKELPVYALIVSKSGLKMKEATEEPAAPAAADDAAKTPPEKENAGKDGNTISTPKGELKMDMKQEGGGMVINMNAPEIGKVRMVVDPAKGFLRYEIAKIKMDKFVDLLTTFADRQVLDMTELKGAYEVPLELPMEEIVNMAKRMMPEIAGMASGGGAPAAAAPASGLSGTGASDPSGGSIFQSVQKLGLKLDSRKVPTEMLVIDRADKEPTEN